MFLFRKKFDKKQHSPNQDERAKRIATKIARRQEAIAGYLSQLFASLSTSQQIVALVVFCLSFGGASILLLVTSIAGGIKQSYHPIDQSIEFKLPKSSDSETFFENGKQDTTDLNRNSNQ